MSHSLFGDNCAKLTGTTWTGSYSVSEISKGEKEVLIFRSWSNGKKIIEWSYAPILFYNCDYSPVIPTFYSDGTPGPTIHVKGSKLVVCDDVTGHVYGTFTKTKL